MDDRRLVSMVHREVTMMPLEQQAVSLVEFEVDVVPSLVQTGDYARAVARSTDIPPEHLESWVEARLMRQFVLTKDNPPWLDMILDEALLRRVVGDHKVMARQLRAILEAADRPNVELRVAPSTPAGLDSGYYFIAADQHQWVAYLEGPTSVVIVGDDADVEPFRQRNSRLNRIALDPAKSADVVAAHAREHERA
jgi:hypothetical protein